jgi:hypothetical protein
MAAMAQWPADARRRALVASVLLMIAAVIAVVLSIDFVSAPNAGEAVVQLPAVGGKPFSPDFQKWDQIKSMREL